MELSIEDRMALGRAAIEGEKEHRVILLREACAEYLPADLVPMVCEEFDLMLMLDKLPIPIPEEAKPAIPILRIPNCADIVIMHFHRHGDSFTLCSGLDGKPNFIVKSNAPSETNDINVAICRARDEFNKPKTGGLFDALKAMLEKKK